MHEVFRFPNETTVKLLQHSIKRHKEDVLSTNKERRRVGAVPLSNYGTISATGSNRICILYRVLRFPLQKRSQGEWLIVT